MSSAQPPPPVLVTGGTDLAGLPGCRGSRDGQNKNKSRNQPCCWQRGAGEAGREEGENSVSPSSVAWGWLWLMAHRLPPLYKMPHKCLNTGCQGGIAAWGGIGVS